jgi:hypothetical protein
MGKPNPGKVDNSMEPALGWLLTEFECFEPNPKYGWDKRGGGVPKNEWKTIEPKKAPPVGDLPEIIKRILERCWIWAGVSEDSVRGPITIGTRGEAEPEMSDTFHPYVRPTNSNINTTFGNNDAIASDWKIFKQIARTNAVTFRGDSRTPYEVITRAKGFFPPISRTDQYYLHNNLCGEFQLYLKRRYNRVLKDEDFVRAVSTAPITDEDKALLVDYLMWRKITEREAVHLGRMVENECQKGYISTARSIDTSIEFATRRGGNGWLYVTVVHGGFMVPWGDQNLWGSGEAEIAQWGPVPAERIVGFSHAKGYELDGPIFFRPSFRKDEPEAFEYMYNVMSGKRP